MSERLRTIRIGREQRLALSAVVFLPTGEPDGMPVPGDRRLAHAGQVALRERIAAGYVTSG